MAPNSRWLLALRLCVATHALHVARRPLIAGCASRRAGRRVATRVGGVESAEPPAGDDIDGVARFQNKALAGFRGIPALAAFGALSWTSLPMLGPNLAVVLSKSSTYGVLSSVEGVVIGALSIVLGTLISTAVSVLRQRQENIRGHLLREATVLSQLSQQLVKLFRYDKSRLDRATAVLAAYIAEKKRSIKSSTVYGYGAVPAYWRAHWDEQQARSLLVLDVIAECIDSQMAGPLYGFSPSSSAAAVYQCEALVFQMNNARTDLRAQLDSGLPRRLFVTIVALMTAVVYCFLLRAAEVSTDQAVSVAEFLAEHVVRVLFVFTTTSFFAILQVLADLADPYSGAFRIDSTILDAAEYRVRGALALAAAAEPSDEILPTLATRADMTLDDALADGLRQAAAE